MLETLLTRDPLSQSTTDLRAGRTCYLLYAVHPRVYQRYWGWGVYHMATAGVCRRLSALHVCAPSSSRCAPQSIAVPLQGVSFRRRLHRQRLSTAMPTMVTAASGGRTFVSSCLNVKGEPVRISVVARVELGATYIWYLVNCIRQECYRYVHTMADRCGNVLLQSFCVAAVKAVSYAVRFLSFRF